MDDKPNAVIAALQIELEQKVYSLRHQIWRNIEALNKLDDYLDHYGYDRLNYSHALTADDCREYLRKMDEVFCLRDALQAVKEK